MAAEALARDADAAAEADQLCVPPIATATPVPGPGVAYRTVQAPLNRCLQAHGSATEPDRSGSRRALEDVIGCQPAAADADEATRPHMAARESRSRNARGRAGDRG